MTNRRAMMIHRAREAPVPHPLPRMNPSPPERYVAFVAGHLDALRRAAADAVGDERDADLLYPEAFTDVAARWAWLELLRSRLDRSAAAEALLWRAFELRARRWRAVLPDPDADGSPPEMDIQVWGSGGPPPRRTATPPDRASVALRLARTAPTRRRTPAERPAAARAEAAIAWWHAYEARRRRWRLLGTIAAMLVLLLLARLRGGMAG